MPKRTARQKNGEPTATYVPVGSAPHVYRVVVEPDEERHYAEIPTLPGCYSWGYTWEEALKNIKQALEIWLEVKREEGEPIPLEDPQTIRRAPLTVGVVA